MHDGKKASLKTLLSKLIYCVFALIVILTMGLELKALALMYVCEH